MWDFYTAEHGLFNYGKFIRVREDCYVINLSFFFGSEDFNTHLLNFISKYCWAKKVLNTKSGCDIYTLEFKGILLPEESPLFDNLDIIDEDSISILFLYPYVDKVLSFNHIFELFSYLYKSDSIYLYIKKF